jgi:hypothetical protein
MGGAAFIFAEIAEPGLVVHSGGPTSITFGELDGRTSRRVIAVPRHHAALASQAEAIPGRDA